MYLRFRRMRHMFWVLPKIYPDNFYRLSGSGINVVADARSTAAWFTAKAKMQNVCKRLGHQYIRHSAAPVSSFKSTYSLPDQYYGAENPRWASTIATKGVGHLVGRSSVRYSSVVETKHEKLSTVDILSFVRSSLHSPRGPSHFWLNPTAGSKNLFKENGIILVLVGEYLEASFEANQDAVKMFEKAKSLQQRYPFLQVLALQHGKSICLNDISTHLLQRIVEKFVTFPILLCNKNIYEMAKRPCYIISKDFQNPIVYPGEDVDLKVLDKAIHDLNAENNKGANLDDVKSTWVKSIEIVKEPDVCSASRNLLFSFPGCISVDESSNRLFLSDVNHHRIIVFNSNGKILDAIGSSPGFEDGEFESAKLMRPAASFYDAFEDCLYFVDSENHAIRRADMERRVVETVFPVTDSTKNLGLWKWILDKIWTKKPPKLKSEEFNSDAFLFPWHLLKSSDNDIFVLSHSFENLWIIDLESGLIREVIKESSKILEICGQMILDKCIPLKQLPSIWLEQQIKNNCSFEGIPYAGVMSSVATCSNNVVLCDTVGQTVVRFSKGTESAKSFQFSNFGILGLPYWLAYSLERVYAVDDISSIDPDHSQSFRLSPGRVDIELNVNIPQHTDLVEPPQEGSIWRQARGAAVEVSGVENKAALTEKVGVAQQWYDEIDNLSFSTQQEESNTVEQSKIPGEEVQDGKIRIGCTINTSPGTSEVIVYAALYLRMKKNSNSRAETRVSKAERIADLLDPKRKLKKDQLVKLLMTSHGDLEELVFTRPLHVRLKFSCSDHRKADNSKAIVLTDSSVKVDVTL